MELDINEYLRERRIEMKLSIQQLSSESGISASHISRIERGARNPSPQALEQLASPLAVDYVTLLKVAGLLDNPNSRCIDLGRVFGSGICVYKERKIPSKIKRRILEILNEYVDKEDL